MAAPRQILSQAASDDPLEFAGQSRNEIAERHRFEGQTVIVTGAASGIGRATAMRVAREGGRVIATDLSAEGLVELVAEVGVGTVAAGVSKAHADVVLISVPPGVDRDVVRVVELAQVGADNAIRSIRRVPPLPCGAPVPVSATWRRAS